MERPDCLRCAAYYVTWNAALPHGCKAFAFQSRALPAIVVRESSGEACTLFERKVSAQRDAEKR